MSRKVLLSLCLVFVLSITGCSQGSSHMDEKKGEQEVTLTVFAAKSLDKVMEELVNEFKKDHENVTVIGNYDSSGTLMTQIQEGATCDIFFSADTRQMDQLESQGGIVKKGTRRDLLNNQVCVVTYEGSKTKVTGLKDLNLASSFALAAGSVPVGKYTRQALVNEGILKKQKDIAAISSETISKALSGVEINECANVGAVTTAVSEGSNEVGTVYYSDTYGLEDKLEILETIPYDLTGDVIYPVAMIHNQQADKKEKETAQAFIMFLTSDSAKEIFTKYLFDVMEPEQK